MARIITYTFIMAGLWIILALGGVGVGTTSLLTAFGIDVASGSLKNAAAQAAITGVFGVAAVAAAAIVGLYTRQSTESVLIAGFATFILSVTFLSFASIITYFFGICGAGTDCNFAAWLIFTLFATLWAAYLISVVQWWRGSDL